MTVFAQFENQVSEEVQIRVMSFCEQAEKQELVPTQQAAIPVFIWYFRFR